MSEHHKIVRFILGVKEVVMRRLRRTLTRIDIAPSVARQGDTTGNGAGVPAGGVAWPVNPDAHDGARFLVADTFLAEYEPQTGSTGAGDRVWMLDDLNVRHPEQEAMRHGFNVFTFKPITRKCKGQVIRTAEYGTDGLDKNVFIPFDEEGLIAHHLQNAPNRNSTKVRDEDGREGPLDDQFRVRRYNPNVRPPNPVRAGQSGNTVTNPIEQPFPPIEPETYGVYLNCGQSGVGDMRGHGMVHFDDKEGRLSSSMDGPLRSCSPKHEQTWTGEAKMGPVEIDLHAQYGDGSDPHSGPLDWTPGPAPKRREPTGIEVEVYFQPDPDKKHHCKITGEHRVKHVWWTRVPVVELPPCKDVKQGVPVTVYQEEPLPSSVFITGPTMNYGQDMLALPAGWWKGSA